MDQEFGHRDRRRHGYKVGLLQAREDVVSEARITGISLPLVGEDAGVERDALMRAKGRLETRYRQLALSFFK